MKIRKPKYLATEGPEDADWIKTLSWDLPTDFDRLIRLIHPDPDLRGQKDALSHLMTLPAWQPAPDAIKTRAAVFLAGRAAVR